ncbi:MAG TPA: aminotransferase class V-fold PLP-dependent enzyme [Bryobacteraceae bacterium]|nr:aminotransferase class V-fold PLP-dependent enzyme [Bryobacteraceae bacterium]
MSIYDDLGIRTIINAKGPSTRVSGALLAPEVTAAMAEAATYCVDMTDLQAGASKIIAEITGAEGGIVTAGAAAGLLLGTAACVAGLDPGKMARLPDTAGMKNEVIMVRSQRNFYDHAIRATGVKIVEVGLPDRVAGAGVRDAEGWEIADAITPATAAVVYVMNGSARPSLDDVIRAAHGKNVPVLVDAAAQLPPVSNLKKFIAAGADLVAFSGGKAIGGPQGSGILCGKRDLIMSAVLQHLDLDIEWAQWQPPANLIDKDRLVGLPPHGIGRTCKVGKETVAGLLVALRRFVAQSDEARRTIYLARVEKLAQELARMRNASVSIRDGMVPKLAIIVNPNMGKSTMEICLALQSGNPAVYMDPGQAAGGILVVNPTALRDADLPALAQRLRDVIG